MPEFQVHRVGGRGILPALALLLSATAATTSFAAEPLRAIKIGALTDSWGPTPSIVGMRDGLVELGYREGEQLEIGVRLSA